MWKVAGLCFILFACAAASYRRTVSYEGQVIVRCYNVTQALYNTVVSQPEVDVWGMSERERTLDVRVRQSDLLMLRRLGLHCELEKDVEQLVKVFEQSMAAKPGATWFEEYHEYDAIVSWYQDLANQNEDLVTYVESIGKSIEGRDMPAVHLTSNKGKDLPFIYFQCQIHAREWISGAVCMYIASYLVENYNTIELVKELLEVMEFIFVPFVNPDGYAYTWTDDRLWRKNRRKGTSCDGVDLNRNYNDHWGGEGSSSNPCSETYHGASEESEVETQNTVAYFKEHSPIWGAIDWHSYSQLILRPYGWTNQNAPDEADLKKVGDEMSSVIEKVHGKVYTSMKAIGLYPTTGTASDWFYTEDANSNNQGYRAYGYTIELRDQGQYGFLLPADQIVPNGEEIVPAVIRFAQDVANNPLKM